MPHAGIVIAASPNAAFYSQIAALIRSLARRRWTRWTYSVNVYVGGDVNRALLQLWQPFLRDAKLHFTSPRRFAIEGDWAQSDDALQFAPLDADVVLALDADTFVMDDLESVLDEVLRSNRIAGVIAHYPTLFHGDDLSSRDVWRRVSAGLTEEPLRFDYVHTLIDQTTDVDPRTPFYLNFGVVFFPRKAFDDVAPRYLALRPRVAERLSAPDFSGQAALTLAIAESRSGTWALPVRYNFPNDPIAARLYPDDAERIVVFHYLRTDRYDRHAIFVDRTQYESFLSQSLTGVDLRFQREVRSLLGAAYPFASDA
jgi:hypothetical protein